MLERTGCWRSDWAIDQPKQQTATGAQRGVETKSGARVLRVRTPRKVCTNSREIEPPQGFDSTRKKISED